MSPRCGKRIVKVGARWTHCRRPERHRGRCSLRSRDLPFTELAKRKRPKLKPVQGVGAFVPAAAALAMPALLAAAASGIPKGKVLRIAADGLAAGAAFEAGRASAPPSETKEQTFCELAADVGVSRVAELLRRMRSIVL